MHGHHRHVVICFDHGHRIRLGRHRCMLTIFWRLKHAVLNRPDPPVTISFPGKLLIFVEHGVAVAVVEIQVLVAVAAYSVIVAVVWGRWAVQDHRLDTDNCKICNRKYYGFILFI